MNSYISECVSTTLAHTEKTLAGKEFYRVAEVDWKSGQKCLSFCRNKRTWLNEQVDVIYPIADKASDSGVEVVFRVALKGPNNQTHNFDGVALSHVVDREQLRYSFPAPLLFKGAALRKYAKSIASDIESGLLWFDAFSSVDSCMIRLVDGKTNLGEVKSTVAAQRALVILQSLTGDGIS